MASKQIEEVLIKDGDIISPGRPVFYFNNKWYGPSKELHDIVNKIFEIYLRYRLYSTSFINDPLRMVGKPGIHQSFVITIDLMMHELRLTKKQEIKYLDDKLQEEIQALNRLIKKNNWLYFLPAIKLEWISCLTGKWLNLIECLKFEILSGRKFQSLRFPYHKIYPPGNSLLDKYFLSNEMEEIYNAAAIRENIKYLQKRIYSLENDNVIKSTLKIQSLNELSYRQIAMFCEYSNIQVEDDKPSVQKLLRDLGIKTTTYLERQLPIFYTLWKKERYALSDRDVITEKELRYRKKDLEKILQVVKDPAIRKDISEDIKTIEIELNL